MKQIVIFFLMAAPTLAHSATAAKTVECFCTDRSGARVEMGESVCLTVDGKSFTAQCQMSLNNPMWRKVSDGCLTS